MATIQGSAKHEVPTPVGSRLLEGPRDFSLLLGGPLYQLLRRWHLCGDALGELSRVYEVEDPSLLDTPAIAVDYVPGRKDPLHRTLTHLCIPGSSNRGSGS